MHTKERIENREEKLNDNEDEDLRSHMKKGKNKRKDCEQSPRRTQIFQRNTWNKRDFSSFECFTCHKMGNIARNCPLKEDQFKKTNKRFHVYAVEDDPIEEKANEDENSSEECPNISSHRFSLRWK